MLRASSVTLLAAAAGALLAGGLTAPALAGPTSDRAVAATAHKVLHPTVELARAERARRGVSTWSGAASGSGALSYHGGMAGVGVTTGAPTVFLVFWGSQWGTAGTDVNGDTTFTGDPSGMAPLLQRMFRGLGTNGELWSGVMTQYCEGVAYGTTTCAAGTPHVGYPKAGVLAGVWLDSSAAAPGSATADQIALEAYAGLAHFAPTSSQVRNTEVVVVSPTGTHPDGYNTSGGGFCAWHDSNLSYSSVPTTYGNFAFTNLPYIPDMGYSCGANYVNAGTAGLLDGVTIVEGHEYAETITDQFPGGGWWDAAGYENGDKCAWNGVGGTGGAQNVTFATGSFAMQSTYSNDGAACRISHAIVLGNLVTVTPPPAVSTYKGQSTTSGTPTATDTVSPATFTWSASGLPSGVSVSSTTGVVSGKPTVTGTYTVTLTATDQLGVKGSASCTWTITATTVTVAQPGNQTTPRSTTISPLTMTATDSYGALTTFTWSASGLPSGLTIASSTGVVSGKTGTTATSYTVKVTAKDAYGSVGSVSFTWKIT